MIRSVVIFGGGAAGWMSATHLKQSFGDAIDITLVESPRIGSIGVGEATFSTIRHFFAHLGLSEEDWMPAAQASYKFAVRYEQWRGRGTYFYHPFERLTTVCGFDLADWWLHLDGNPDRFQQHYLIVPSLCDARRSPRSMDGSLFSSQPLSTGTDDEGLRAQFPYAYHFDASLFAAFLRRLGTERGVRHVADEVVHVEQDSRGWITLLLTREHGPISGELFIDCTGFRGSLINEVLEEEFISFEEVLPNNRAVALRVPTDVGRHGIRPYTTATAVDSGWIWSIPLFDRVGAGYVYSDAYCSPEQAEATLRRQAADGDESLPANHIRMRVGRNRRSWVKNCVAIGLSSGFVEPLESTGIFFIQNGIEELVRHFPNAGWEEHLTDSYNRIVARAIDGVRDFLVLHYRAARRNDTPYWRDAKTRRVPASLLEPLAQWSRLMPEESTIYPYFHGFEPYSWKVMLIGLGSAPTVPRPALAYLDPGPTLARVDLIRRESKRLAQSLPSCYEYLAQLNG